MSAPSGFGKDIPWQRGSKKQEAAPEQPPASPPPTTASVPPPAPDNIGEGGGIDMRIVFGVSCAVIVLAVSLLLLYSSTAPTQEASAQTPAVPAATAPVPVSTPIPTATSGVKFIEMVDQLLIEKQYEAAARMAEKALQTAQLSMQLSSPERTALQERAFTARLHALVAQERAYLDVPVQQQQVNRYKFLKEQARAAGIPFLSSLEVAQLAKANGHWRLAKLAYEEAFTQGAFSLADELVMRQYEEVLFRQGWWQAQGTGSTKEEGLQLLATRYAFDKAHGRAKDHAWAELMKYCGTDETTWPKPAETPLLVILNGGS
jgi:hypothetical protein